jgi:hypothetical protein
LFIKDCYDQTFCKCNEGNNRRVENLNHILNGCIIFRGSFMTIRHDKIVNRFFDAIHSILKLEKQEV